MSTSSPSTPKPEPIRIYLSGGMEYAANEGRDWRSALQEWLETTLHCSIFNPNRESERFLATRYPGLDLRELKFTDLSRFTRIVSEIVDLDSREIAERTDVVVCYWDKAAMRGAGTKGELTMAKYAGKPVYMVTSIPPVEIPGWVLGCTTRIFASFEELKAFLMQGAEELAQNPKPQIKPKRQNANKLTQNHNPFVPPSRR
jgi:hypothetical protein